MKTLEEILLEKASQRKGDTLPKTKAEPLCSAGESKPVAKPPVIRIKTFSEVLAEKKQRQLEEERLKSEKESLTEPKSESQKQNFLAPPITSRRKPDETPSKAKDFGEVRIKTLEEIKQEKALRMQQSGERMAKIQMQPGHTLVGRRSPCSAKPTGTAPA